MQTKATRSVSSEGMRNEAQRAICRLQQWRQGSPAPEASGDTDRRGPWESGAGEVGGQTTDVLVYAVFSRENEREHFRRSEMRERLQGVKAGLKNQPGNLETRTTYENA